MKTPEAYEKAEICRYLDSIGAWYFKPMITGFGKSGVPDIIACYQGRFIAIEAKREGKAPTPIQDRRLNEIRALKGIGVAGTAKQVISYLNELLP